MSGGGGDNTLGTVASLGAAVLAPELAPTLMEGTGIGSALGLTAGGIGETALTGMALGGLGSALTGGNAARGALLGGAGAGIGSLLGGGTPAATPTANAAAATPAAATSVGGNAATLGANYGAGAAATSSAGTAPGMSFDSFGNPVQAGSATATSADPTGLAAQQQAALQQGAGSSGSLSAWYNSLSPMQKMALIGGGGALGISALQSMSKPNTLPAYNPVTYAGMNRTLAAGYQPYHPMAAGGVASSTSGGEPEVGAQYALSNQGQQTTQVPSQVQALMSQYGVTPQEAAQTVQALGSGATKMAGGGIAQLAVGGKLLKGQGDGMSDSIDANISGARQARLADGEFVVPADVVSHLGNGSTDAGAKQLYSMMDKVRQARTGRKAQGKQINPQKYIPA